LVSSSYEEVTVDASFKYFSIFPAYDTGVMEGVGKSILA
jgi:hypothetical protein